MQSAGQICLPEKQLRLQRIIRIHLYVLIFIWFGSEVMRSRALWQFMHFRGKISFQLMPGTK